MKLYNQNNDKIEDIEYFDKDGIKYISKMSEEELNSYGYFKLKYKTRPSSRYYTYTENVGLIGNLFTFDYIRDNKPLDDVKKLMLQDLKETLVKVSEKPIVDTGLGFSVDGGRIDVKNFEIGKKYNLPMVKAADNNFYPVTQEDYDTIISAIELNGIMVYQRKWEIEQEIAGLTSVAECERFENEPYEVTEEIIDYETGQPTGETQVVTKYKNNVKEW